MIDQGLVHSVRVVTLGSYVAADAAIGATALAMDSVLDFNEDGGTLAINGAPYAYTAADFDLNTLTLAAPLPVAAVTADRVDVMPLSTEKQALVVMADSEDAVIVRIPHALVDRMPEGIRDVDAQESIQFEWVQGEFVMADVVGLRPVVDGSYIDPVTAPPAGSDGTPPASSPAVVLIPGIRSFLARWQPIVNGDPVTYDLHVSSDPALATTYGPGTLVTSTPASMTTVLALPGAAPAPGQPDLRALHYDTDYYALVVARDADGAAAPGAVASVRLIQVTGPDVAAQTLTGEAFIGGTFSGREFAGEVFIANTFKTAPAGQRTEFGINGIQQYRPDETLSLNLPNDGGENLFDGEVVARGLTVKAGASFESDENEITKDGALILAVGITSPSAAPQLAVTYETVRPVTVSQSGPLGTFALNPAEVSFVQWNPITSAFHVHQVRPGGTRVWTYDRTGALTTPPGDIADWEIWGQTTIASGTKAGGYNLFRFIPGGNSWYVSGPASFNLYARLNVNRRPAIGNNGTDLFVAETLATGQLNIGYRAMSPTDGAPLPAASTTHTSATGIFGASPLVVDRGVFDFGADRYVVAERGVNFNAKSFSISGTSLVNVAAESWESPVASRLGQVWDGTNFWTYGSDGLFYKHTTERWDPAVQSSVYWAKTTFYDSDAGGTGTHETTPGPVRSITARRRATVTVTLPEIPDNGGADDPDQNRLYMARGATQPPDTSLKLQYGGSAAKYAFTTLATATAAPPTTNNFPGANPAVIRSPDSGLVISGNNTIDAVTIRVQGLAVATYSGAGDLTNKNLTSLTNTFPTFPYVYAHLNADSAALTSGTWTTLTTWTVDDSSGITYSAGTFAVPMAGRYRVTFGWSSTANAVGSRGARVAFAGTTKQNIIVPTNPTAGVQGSVQVVSSGALAVGGTIQTQAWQNSGAGAPGISARGDAGGMFTTVQIEYIGP